MHIFITGVAGFLGSHLAKRFLSIGHQVSGCDNLLGGEMMNVPPEIKFFNYDCRNFNDMVHSMQTCELVYHCAATAYDGFSIFSPSLVMDNIVTGSITVFSAAISCGVKKIIFCSSMSRYGTGKFPFVEDHEPRPQNPYGIGKLAAEQALANLCQTHGVEYAVAVPHNIIGERQKYDDPYRNVASIMSNLMLQGRSPIIYGDGEQTRCFSHVDDCISCLVELGLKHSLSGEVINIGPDEDFISINDLFRKIKKLTDFEGQAVYLPDRPMEVKHAVCSSDKARRLLGYQTSKSIDDGLKDIVNYIKRIGIRKFQYHLKLEIVTNDTPISWRDRLF